MSGDITKYLFALVLSVIVVIIIQALLLRVFKTQSRQKITMLAMLLGYFAFFTIINRISFSEAKNLAFYIYMAAIYSFSAYTYFHAFNMSETSRRIRLLLYIGSRSSTKPEDLDTLYNAKEMYEIRLERLAALGQITECNNKYFIVSPLFAITARLFYFLGCLVNRPWPEVTRFKQDMNKSV